MKSSIKSARTMESLAETYLAERRSLGFDLKISGQVLMNFAHFADTASHRAPITESLVLAWAHSTPSGRAITWARRIEVIRPFAKYLKQYYPDTIVPRGDLCGRAHRRLAPHIYTERELDELLTASAAMLPAGSIRPLTYEALFGLIAATGLRISEAINLSRDDVNPADGTLIVRETKFHRSRLIPLHSTVTLALKHYAARRALVIATEPCNSFFVNRDGKKLRSSTVHWAFGRLREQLGWVARGDHALPRIHDLRHSFVCRRILTWYQDGVNVDHHMMALSTYLGHVKPSDTYWYLTAVPDLMEIVSQKFARFAEGGRHE
ncbi:tyrosine-type recombinase/integrase [Paraburkholderia hospita]|uniref:tyrosine-type recombinase/integrase n=1 Tax=Paraburkholderia hospita TaxID=169430 RepID=UPI000DEF2C92|nr:tyrosine-type recombinase/integrase [Paraburkholderia hospita]AXF06012.1 integrase [Paraburkholderia hospita]